METYIVQNEADADGKVFVRRVSDNKTARCKMSWLETAEGGTYQAISKTKAIRMDGLEWV